MGAKAMISRALRQAAPQGAVAATMSRTARQGSGPSAEAGHLPPAYTPAEFNAFMIMLDRGTHAAEGMSASGRTLAMRGMRIMETRDPRRLGRLIHAFDQGAAVSELVAYEESRVTA